MANENVATGDKVKKNVAPPAAETNTAIAPGGLNTEGFVSEMEDDEFRTLDLERKIYNFGACREYPIQGKLIKAAMVSEGKFDEKKGEKAKDFWCFQIELTAPSVYSERTGVMSPDPKKKYRVLRAEIGDVLHVNVTHDMMELADFAVDPKFVQHLRIRIGEQKLLPNGHLKWPIECALGKRELRSVAAPQTVGIRLPRPHPIAGELAEDTSFNHGANALGNGSAPPRQLGS